MQILKAQYLISSPEISKCPKPDRPEFAFIGRSNVGKSSLINMLCGNEKLAKTSAAPGKTQLINHFQISSRGGDSLAPDNWFLVDLPGYGFAKVSQRTRRRWEQMIENYLRKRENLMMVFVLIDARLKPQKIDLLFLQQLDVWQVPCSIVFTKSDKVNQRTVSENVRLFLEELKKYRQFLPQHVVTSAVKKSGRNRLLDLLKELLQQD